MRLLHIGPSGQLAFTKDLIHDKDDIPPYAILSHTWANDPDDEVTYKDIKKQRAVQKPGYQKIHFCAKQAEQDGLGHFWVDTCCIDKTNAVELSESINSMFCWYQQAEKCYSYLSDVSSGHTGENEPWRSTWKQDFQKSKWFTRGWTLQELLAPSIVEFFSAEKQRLGDKKSLAQTICEITGIPLHALEGVPLSKFSPAERISWSGKRTTSKKEDRAYSLLGMLSISMSTIYGEGEKNAFDRLHAEISRRSISSLLNRLPVSDQAAFDCHADEHNPQCHPDTRTEILREVSEWAQIPGGNSVYWMNGMAGTGKSTISRTLAHYFAKSHSLGATFFFKRREGDRGGMSKFFTTIVSHLVQQLPEMAWHVSAVMDEHPAIVSKSMREQFKELIIEPISKLSVAHSTNRTRLIIIDALDECERKEDVKVLIHLLSTLKISGPLRLKFFLTSRPDFHIRTNFRAIHGTFHEFILHGVKESVIERDITAYLGDEMKNIREQFNRSARSDQLIPPDWPRTSDLQALVQMAIPLFIFAATISRFIADGRVATPAEQLEEVLKYRTKSQESQLDATYLPVLRQMVAGLNQRTRERVMKRFQVVVGSIVTLANPLPLSALSELLQVPISSIDGALEALHSVLSVPATIYESAQSLHSSFRDFLVDSARREDSFWIDEKDVHQKLASQCLRVLNASLKYNVCHARAPETEARSISVSHISSCISPELQYACRFWTYHLQESSFATLNSTDLWQFLSSHFLQWLEALSWMGRLSQSEAMIETLQHFNTAKTSRELEEYLIDSLRFVRDGKIAMERCPLQIYYSALFLAPDQSIIRNCYKQHIPSWIDLKIRTEPSESSVLSVVFSRDGKKVASTSADGVAIWSAETGERQVAFEKSRRSPYLSIEFSPDGRKIALSWVGLIVVSSTETGQIESCLEGHKGWVYLVVFSPDGKQVSAVSKNDTITLWSSESGRQQATLQGHTNSIRSLAYSPNGKHVSSTSSDDTVMIWSAETGQQQFTVEGYQSPINSIAYPPPRETRSLGPTDGLAWIEREWAVDDNTVIFWSVKTCKFYQVVKNDIVNLQFDSAGAPLMTDTGPCNAMSEHDILLNAFSALRYYHLACSSRDDCDLDNPFSCIILASLRMRVGAMIRFTRMYWGLT